MEQIADRYKLKFLHMIVTVIGIPLVLTMGGIIGTMVLNQVGDMKADLRVALNVSASNDKRISIVESHELEADRRITSLETWHEAFAR